MYHIFCYNHNIDATFDFIERKNKACDSFCDSTRTIVTGTGDNKVTIIYATLLDVIEKRNMFPLKEALDDPETPIEFKGELSRKCFNLLVEARQEEPDMVNFKTNLG